MSASMITECQGIRCDRQRRVSEQIQQRFTPNVSLIAVATDSIGDLFQCSWNCDRLRTQLDYQSNRFESHRPHQSIRNQLHKSECHRRAFKQFAARRLQGACPNDLLDIVNWPYAFYGDWVEVAEAGITLKRVPVHSHGRYGHSLIILVEPEGKVLVAHARWPIEQAQLE